MPCSSQHACTHAYTHGKSIPSFFNMWGSQKRGDQVETFECWLFPFRVSAFSSQFPPEWQVSGEDLQCATITPSCIEGKREAVCKQTFLNQPRRNLCCHLRGFQLSGAGLWVCLRSLNMNPDILEFNKNFLTYCMAFINFAMYLSDIFLYKTWKVLLGKYWPFFFLTAFGGIMKENKCSIASNSLTLFSLKELTWDLSYNQWFKENFKSIPNCLSDISN